MNKIELLTSTLFTQVVRTYLEMSEKSYAELKDTPYKYSVAKIVLSGEFGNKIEVKI